MGKAGSKIIRPIARLFGFGRGGGVETLPDPQAAIERDRAIAEARAAAQRMQDEEARAAVLKAELDRINREYAIKMQQYVDDIRRIEEENREKDRLLKRIMDDIERDSEHISSLEELAEKNRARFETIISLAQGLAAEQLRGTNIGFIGNTSCGKSTTINAVVGSRVCETGYDETTLTAECYTMPPPHTVVCWDIPGSNNELSYIRAPYISMLKAMAFVGLMIENTVKEISQVARLMDHLGLDYYLIVNKMDDVDADEVDKFKSQIHSEVASLLGIHCKGVFFISAKNAFDNVGADSNEDWFRLKDTIISIDCSATSGKAAAGGKEVDGAKEEEKSTTTAV